jgi:hypothetical protein
MARNTYLPEVVDTIGPVGRIARALHCGHEKAQEQGNDRDDHEQLNQREGATLWLLRVHDQTP